MVPLEDARPLTSGGPDPLGPYKHCTRRPAQGPVPGSRMQQTAEAKTILLEEIA